MPSQKLSIKSNLRQKLHWLGSAFALAGIIFVVIRMRTYWLELDFSKVTPQVWLAIGTLAIVYGLANILLASAWRHLLIHLGAPVSRLWSIRIYGISQLAKYLPGNIFHLAGRQALGMAAGLPTRALAKSTFWELGLIVLTAALFSSLVLPVFLPSFSVILCVPILLMSACVLAAVLRKFGGPETVRAFFCQGIFLAISAGIFTMLVGVISVNQAIPAQLWPTIGGAYIVAWLAGLITPGAPAGVGVREMILLLLLKGAVQEADLLMAILLGRLVTVTGDLLFFVGASFLQPKAKLTDTDNA